MLYSVPLGRKILPMNPSMSIRWASLLRVFLFVLAALPALYIFGAIQYASITVPFWDHTELIHWITSWHDGTFQVSSLWEPHNHTRPLVYRFVMLVNAVLTDWDIRSEYVYIYLAIFGTFACHVWALRQVTLGAKREIVYPIVLLLLSLILFSPVGHNNHWWSMMFQLDATNLFVTFGLLTCFVRPRRWSNHVLAALSCWLATFTLTNGFFAVIAVGLVFQMSAKYAFRPSRWALFWGANLLVLLVIYIPGITLSTSSAHPTLLQLAQFCLAYLGAPLGGLLLFQYQNMFDIPLSITFNSVCGALLLLTWALLCWHARSLLREQHSAALILFGFGIFAILSALATGWGRAAFDEFGVAAGNSSRYTIFGAYLLFGQLYYVGVKFAYGQWNSGRVKLIAVIGAIAFVLLAVISYGRSVKVYINAHDFNKTLLHAYPWGLQPTKYDKSIHHNLESVTSLKRDLQRLEIGPYSNRYFNKQILAIGDFRKAGGLLAEGRVVTQRFTATEDGLKAIGFTLVTPNGEQTSGAIEWQVTEVGSTTPVAQGTLDASLIHDWQVVRLKLPYIDASKGREYSLALSSKVDDAQGLGVALYTPPAGHNSEVTTFEPSGAKAADQLSMALQMEYAK